MFTYNNYEVSIRLHRANSERYEEAKEWLKILDQSFVHHTTSSYLLQTQDDTKEVFEFLRTNVIGKKDEILVKNLSKKAYLSQNIAQEVKQKLLTFGFKNLAQKKEYDLYEILKNLNSIKN